MYPRNAASPPRIGLGPVVQISDGAVQSSGVSVVVAPEGGSETASGGTVAYGGTSNSVYYTPTQAETNYTAFVVTAYKTGCIPVSVTIVTTASSTAGQAEANVVSISGDTTAADNAESFFDGTGYAGTNNVIPRVTLADTLTTYTGNTPQTGDSYPIVSHVTYGNSALKTLIDTLTGYVDTEVAAIKAKTDGLPSDPADASDIAAAFSTVNSTLSTIAAYIDTEVVAIKAKTDNLPTDPADASDIAASFSSIASTLATIAAYIDTEVAAIKAKTDNLPADPADASDVAAVFVTVNTKLDTIDDFLDTEIAAIKAKTDALPTDPADQSLVEAAITSAVSTIRGADNDTLKTISDQIDASDAPTVEEIDTYLTTQHGAGSWATGGSGAGAFTLTITVNDGTTALQNATVRLTEGVNVFTASTNASGVAVFALDAATYAVAITKDGYQFTPTTKVVSATGSQTYSMSATSITPSDPDRVTGYATTLDESGVAQSGVSVTCRVDTAMIPASLAGLIFDAETRTEVSNGSGLVEFTNLVPGVPYVFSRGTGTTPRRMIADDVDFEIGCFAGRDS